MYIGGIHISNIMYDYDYAFHFRKQFWAFSLLWPFLCPNSTFSLFILLFFDLVKYYESLSFEIWQRI